MKVLLELVQPGKFSDKFMNEMGVLAGFLSVFWAHVRCPTLARVSALHRELAAAHTTTHSFLFTVSVSVSPTAVLAVKSERPKKHLPISF